MPLWCGQGQVHRFYGSVSGVIITQLWWASWFPLGPAGKCWKKIQGSTVTASFHISPVLDPLLLYHSVLHSRTYVHRRQIDQKWIHKACINTNQKSGDLIILFLYNAPFEPVTIINVEWWSFCVDKESPEYCRDICSNSSVNTVNKIRVDGCWFAAELFFSTATILCPRPLYFIQRVLEPLSPAVQFTGAWDWHLTSYSRVHITRRHIPPSRTSSRRNVQLKTRSMLPEFWCVVDRAS